MRFREAQCRIRQSPEIPLDQEPSFTNTVNAWNSTRSWEAFAHKLIGINVGDADAKGIWIFVKP